MCEVSLLHPIDSVSCIGERILGGVGQVVSSAFDTVFGGVVDWLTGLVTDAVAAVTAALGTFWVSVRAPAVGTAANTPSSTVGFLTAHLGWYTAALAVVSVLVGAGRMALQRKAQPGVDTARSVLTLAVVSGLGVAGTALLTEAADEFSVWIIGESTGGSFGANLTALLGFATVTGAGLVIVLVLGLVAILASMIQVILMVMRIGMIMLLVAALPTAAAATNTEMGKQWFKKLLAWLIAYILYKPVASIIYALAFTLVGDTSITADGGLLSMMIGVALMLMALLGLPALMRFLVPAVSAVAGGSGAGAMAVGAVASGAMIAAGGGFAGAAGGSGSIPSGTPVGGGGGASGNGGGNLMAAAGADSSGAATPGGPTGGAAAGGDSPGQPPPREPGNSGSGPSGSGPGGDTGGAAASGTGGAGG
jgi:type IV secretion system protein TrbL